MHGTSVFVEAYQGMTPTELSTKFRRKTGANTFLKVGGLMAPMSARLPEAVNICDVFIQFQGHNHN